MSGLPQSGQNTSFIFDLLSIVMGCKNGEAADPVKELPPHDLAVIFKVYKVVSTHRITFFSFEIVWLRLYEESIIMSRCSVGRAAD